MKHERERCEVDGAGVGDEIVDGNGFRQNEGD
jgi:hypothetical protein